MTDSEDDVFSNNVHSFPVDRMVIHAKGPNCSITTTLRCRDPSPMSLRRVPDFRPRNFHHPFSVGVAGYGRSGLPTSGRDIDTNISISATDIALAIKNGAYDKLGLNLIKKALNKQFKKKLRNIMEKRRNQRLLLQMSKHNSGEEGSDLSISSDDCRYRDNLAHFKKKVDEDNLYKDCTKEIQRKSFKKISSDALPAKIPTQIEAQKPIHSNSEKSVLLKDRFQIGFSLPSERFNKTSKNSSHPSRHNDNNVRPTQIINGKQQINNKKIPENNVNVDFESQEEEIFSEITAMENNCNIDDISHKKMIDLDELHSTAPLNGDLSMQPSFIKRKSFTQKLDVAEKKTRSDSSLSSSPQVKYVSGNKEKNKARKLASSQSSLREDVLEEDKNFLDLIHKVVPADQMNITNADEEIFKINNHCNIKAKIQTITKSLSELTTNCKVVLDKLPHGELNKTASNIAHKQTFINEAQEQCKESPKVKSKSFWDTDSESELENHDYLAL